MGKGEYTVSNNTYNGDRKREVDKQGRKGEKTGKEEEKLGERVCKIVKCILTVFFFLP